MMGVAQRSHGLGPVIWVHVHSREALRSFAGIARKTAKNGVEAHFLITGSAQDLEDFVPPANVVLSALPSDRGRELRSFLRDWSPTLGFWVGTPLFPAAIRAVQSAGTPVVLLNATEDLADPAGGFFHRRAVHKLLPNFRMIFAENHITGGICMHYGAAEGAVHVTGLLSEAPMALPCDPEVLDQAAAAVGSRDIWFATQVPMSELDLVIAAHEKLRAANRRLLLILNTQQIESEETLAIDLAAKGWRVGVRIKGDEITDNTQIYLSSGSEELGLWYRLSPVSLIGGTFSNDVSSADPMQAAALGSAILHGPGTSPFRDAFDQLHAQTPAAATQVVNPSSLARHVETLLAPHLAAEQANAAWEYVSQGAELTDNVISLIEQAVDLVGQLDA